MVATRQIACAVVTAALLALTSSASALTFTCEGIARKGSLDPAGDPLPAKFGKNRHGGPAINSSGDVVFFATPPGGPRRLYLYPNGGAALIVAEHGSPAPSGGTFTQFRQPSINDGGDLAFFGDLALGEGVFIDPAAGGMFAAALSGNAAPGGGTFETFEGVSRINAAGDVAFFAIVTGGPSGIFRFDAGSTLVVSEARVGDVALDGREICDFVAPAVGLGGSEVAFQASTKVSCADTGETALIGIYRTTLLGIVRVALQGDATPVAGTTYDTFYGDPDLNAGDQVLFRASIVGTTRTVGLFLFDLGGPTTTLLAQTGDAAPGGGLLRTITEPNLTDAGRAGFRANVRKDPSNQGIFLFDGTDEAVVRRNDQVPTNLFVPGSTYAKIFEEIGVDRGGTWVTYSGIVREVGLGGKGGLFRCQGS